MRGKPSPCIATPESGAHHSWRPAFSCYWECLRNQPVILSARREVSKSRTPKDNESGSICFVKPERDPSDVTGSCRRDLRTQVLVRRRAPSVWSSSQPQVGMTLRDDYEVSLFRLPSAWVFSLRSRPL